jgi:hypothetical protein
LIGNLHDDQNGNVWQNLKVPVTGKETRAGRAPASKQIRLGVEPSIGCLVPSYLNHGRGHLGRQSSTITITENQGGLGGCPLECDMGDEHPIELLAEVRA